MTASPASSSNLTRRVGPGVITGAALDADTGEIVTFVATPIDE